MTELEYKLLTKREKSTLTNEEEKNSSDEKELGDQNLPVRAVTKTPNLTGTEMKDKVQFKRKKAKVMNHFYVCHISVFIIPSYSFSFFFSIFTYILFHVKCFELFLCDYGDRLTLI